MSEKLQFDEFLRSISISKNDSYALLLGAGCSISSDVQSAHDCMWEWKKIIYKSNHPNTSDWINNYKQKKVQFVIQHWLDNQGEYIENESDEEYSYYAKKCFPIEDDRRQYFQKICSNKKPSIGYRIVPVLNKQGMLDSVWTTNFDDLVSASCVYGGIQGIDISLDSIERINNRAQNRNELPIVKLHGDFKYGELKNTTEELQNQDQTFREKLIQYLSDKHLIVIGYSGRDISLMHTLKEAYSKSGGGRLFWCGYGDSLDENVSNLLDIAKANRRSAFYVSTDGFDNTMLSLSKLVAEDNVELKKEIAELQKSSVDVAVNKPFNLQISKTNKVLKSNLFPIELPKEVFMLDANLGEKPWKTVKDRSLLNNDIVAAPYSDAIWALGKLEDINENFKDLLKSDIQRKPLAHVKIHHSSVSFLMLSSISKLFASLHELETNYKDKIWSQKDYRVIKGKKVFNAIRLAIENIQGDFYLTLNPDFQLEDNEVAIETKQSIGLEFFHKIWNKEFNIYVDQWRKRILTEDNYEFPKNSGSGFIFKIKNTPIFTDVCDLNNNYQKSHNVPESYLKLKGVQFKEVGLLFSAVHGKSNVTDIHPMRGLSNNMPFETNLDSFLNKTIELGVICPESDSKLFTTFLNKQHSKIAKDNPNDNYIIDFKGFYDTYGVSLNIPTTTSDNWEFVTEPNSQERYTNAQELKQLICDKILKLTASGSSKVIVIYIPTRWDDLTYYQNDDETFDLHDYIKAFCAEKRVTSQFIREKTVIDKKLSCQINWWLSLSYYVKSFRTPWILNNTDQSTAFAGIGYSLNKKRDDKNHIVLGCSHIYSSNGEGLKYKLSKLNDDKIQWRSKKPHLGYDDAYEFGLNVLTLFLDSMNELPKRVVIHKRTFFTEEEQSGILDSLHSNPHIENVDLVEVNFEDDIRYVSSKINEGKTTIDGFSVSRGTCIQLNKREALLWAHGVIPSVKNVHYNFYPGGRYIPKPLKIIKHYGNGTLEQISNEILGLTKMNWNSLNMYSQLPATITSSNAIARIGKLIQNRDKVEYDYRFFI